MGTRADFYVGRGKQAEWLGSIAWDGYPSGLEAPLLNAKTEAEFRTHVATLSERDDWTAPADGWPWPWDDSQTTDYAYAFDTDKVFASSFGGDWFAASEPEPEGESSSKVAFPNMAARKAVTLGRRSGLIVLGGN